MMNLKDLKNQTSLPSQLEATAVLERVISIQYIRFYSNRSCNLKIDTVGYRKLHLFWIDLISLFSQFHHGNSQIIIVVNIIEWRKIDWRDKIAMKHIVPCKPEWLF